MNRGSLMGMSVSHHLLLFRPFAGVHGAEKLTGSYRAGKRTGWNRPVVDDPLADADTRKRTFSCSNPYGLREEK